MKNKIVFLIPLLILWCTPKYSGSDYYIDGRKIVICKKRKKIEYCNKSLEEIIKSNSQRVNYLVRNIRGNNYEKTRKIFYLIKNLGVEYKHDEKLYPIDRNLSPDQVAFVSAKIPEKTLEEKWGNCADLYVLFSSLLKARSILTARITIFHKTSPHHIYLMFPVNPYNVPEESKKYILNIYGNYWLPLETSEIEGTFEEAISKGYKKLKKAKKLKFENLDQ